MALTVFRSPITFKFSVAARYCCAMLTLPVTMLPKSFTSPISSFSCLVAAQKIFRPRCRFAVTHCIERKTDNTANENRPPANLARPQQLPTISTDFLRGHQTFVSLLRIEVEASKIVDERCIEEQAIESIEYAPMARQNVGCVFCSRAAFERAFREVAKNSDDSHDCCEWQSAHLSGSSRKNQKCASVCHRECGRDSANHAFPRFSGTHRWREFMFPEAVRCNKRRVRAHQHQKEERQQVCEIRGLKPVRRATR